MPRAEMKAILQDARKRRYAIPNLWGTSVEMLLGQIRAAEELRAPLGICVNQALCPELPLELGVRIISAAADAARVPVVTSLDHGSDYESCIRAIHYGVSAVMFDGSYLPYEENVRITRGIVRVAHAVGVSVEGELGAVGGSAAEWGRADEYESIYTDPDQVVDFVEKTGVDALAISFGNRHGLYKGKPELNYNLVREIGGRVDTPLVMHGASDLPEEEYPRIVESGICKIHFWSGPAKLAAENLLRRLNESAGAATPVGYREVFEWNADFFYEATLKMLRLMNGPGKA